MSRWSDLTLVEIGEAADAGAIAVLPVGATEQHGPHLATGTDTLLAERAAVVATERTGDLCLPPVAYGCSLGHTDQWPGTLSLSAMTLTALVMDIGRWVHASGLRKLVLVNGHATNGPPCESALLQLRHELPDLRMRFVSLFDLTPEIAAAYTADAPDFHANEAETSMLLHLAGSLVRWERVVDEPDVSTEHVLRYAMPDASQSGVVGRPSTATSAAGEQLFSSIVAGLADLLERARGESPPSVAPR